MIYESTYKVITPSGVFDAVWGEYPLPVEYRGNPAAIQHFKNFLALNHVSGEHGMLLNEKTLEPNELYGFCQPTGSGITVIPPLDDLIAYAQEERELDQQNDEPKQDTENEETQAQFFHRTLKTMLGQDNELSQAALDSANTQESNNVNVTGIEKLKLTKELRGIRAGIALAANGIEKLKMIKRVKEIRVVFGGKVKELAPVAETEETNPGISQKDIDDYEKNRVADPETDELNVTGTIDNMLANVKTYFTSANPLPELIPSNWIIMNTTRPLVGTKTFENATYLHGRFYAAIDPNDEFALHNIKTNIGLDGYVIKLIGNSLLFKMVKNTIPEKYLEALGKLPIDKQNQYMLDKKESINGKPYSEAMIMMENAYDKPEAENAPVQIPEGSNTVVAEESEVPSVVDNPVEEPEPEAAAVEDLVQPIVTEDQNNIVMNEGSGVVINQIYKQWEAIKSEYDQTDWEDSVINAKFGSYGTTPFLDVLKTFEPKFKNSVLEENFMKEVRKALSKPAPLTLSTETEKQKRKLQSLTDMQERMKAANKIIKSKTLTDEQKKEKLEASGEDYYRLMRPDFAGRVGYADYLLTNNNATIRNTAKRIAQLEAQDLAAAKASSGDSATSYDFDGGSIDLDYADDRLKVNFDSKPASDMRDKLKQNGFNWSPTNGTWQRKLTDNAISTANYLFGTKIQTAASAMQEEVNKPSENGIVAPVVHETPASQENPMQAAFAAELESLKMERDIDTYDKRLDEIYARIEKAGLAEELDDILQATADVLTGLLAEAEKKGS